jgi:hypothetical protein
LKHLSGLVTIIFSDWNNQRSGFSGESEVRLDGRLWKSDRFGVKSGRKVLDVMYALTCRVVWEVKEVEKFFKLIRPANIGGLVGKKFFSSREVWEVGRMRRTYGSSRRK